MNTAILLDYLSALSENNNREWFHAHKPEYQAANAAFEELLQELILRMGQTDNGILHHSPKELTFKLNRDTRFSHDKSPYLPAFRAHISSGGKLPIPVGYYLMIKPGGQSFLGGGLFADGFQDATARVRDYLSRNSGEWVRIIQAPEFSECFTVRGTALKKVPAGYEKHHPQAEFLKHKSWYIEFPVPDDAVRDAELFVELAVDRFLRMRPFNDYLNLALEGFQMPQRP